LTLEERVEEVVEEFGSRLDWDRDFKTCIWLFIF
jgi:leucyl-tRNA synthetase